MHLKWLIPLLVATPAFAQQQVNPVDRAFLAALQANRLGTEMQQVGSDMQMQVKALQDRIVELQKICGDPCKSEVKNDDKH